ncbi:hypothetical protein [Peribacillus asahii]|uniref:hypothetical protein n=1 Tax=Peribacillus asahii TaxID=228899 RepID=UPI00382EC8BA
MADVGKGNAYIYSGIVPETDYRITVAAYDKFGNFVRVNENAVLSGNGTNGTVSNFAVNEDGTFTFTYSSALVGAGDTRQDSFDILVDGNLVLHFWTNSYPELG